MEEQIIYGNEITTTNGNKIRYVWKIKTNVECHYPIYVLDCIEKFENNEWVHVPEMMTWF